MTYSDEQLIAFLDRALGEDELRAIEAALASSPELEQRMMALDPVAPQMRALARYPGPERLKRLRQNLLDGPGSGRGRAAVGLALAASLAVGVALGWQFFAPAPPDWRHEAARYQALYVPQTVAHLDLAPAVLSEQFARASAALGAPLSQETLSQVAGLELGRAQILGFEGQALIQIVFRDAMGTPMALCVMAGPSLPDAEGPLAGLASYSWGTDGYQYLLIGGTDQSAISAFGMNFRGLQLLSG